MDYPNIHTVRSLVQKRLLTLRYVVDVTDWELITESEPFDFESTDEPQDNWVLYKLSNHKKETTFRIHTMYEDETFRTWWYNFDDWFETDDAIEMAKHLINWFQRLIEETRGTQMRTFSTQIQNVERNMATRPRGCTCKAHLLS
jgi:hypothetical protein